MAGEAGAATGGETRSEHSCCLWGWGDTAAAYRLLDNERCEWREIIEAHGRCALQRVTGRSVVLCLHDTTELDLRNPCAGAC